MIDLAATQPGSPGSVRILYGDGTGGFVNPKTITDGIGNAPSAIAVGDFNGDGRADLVVANQASNRLTVLLAGC